MSIKKGLDKFGKEDYQDIAINTGSIGTSVIADIGEVYQGYQQKVLFEKRNSYREEWWESVNW